MKSFKSFFSNIVYLLVYLCCVVDLLYIVAVSVS